MEVKKRTQIATWQQETRQHVLSSLKTMYTIIFGKYNIFLCTICTDEIYLLEHTRGRGISLKKGEALALGLIQARPCLCGPFPGGPLVPVCQPLHQMQAHLFHADKKQRRVQIGLKPTKVCNHLYAPSARYPPPPPSPLHPLYTHMFHHQSLVPGVQITRSTCITCITCNLCACITCMRTIWMKTRRDGLPATSSITLLPADNNHRKLDVAAHKLGSACFSANSTNSPFLGPPPPSTLGFNKSTASPAKVYILAAVNSPAGLCSGHAIAYIVIVVEGRPLFWAAHI